MTTEDDVRRLCLDLPGVTERPSWGREPGVLTVKTRERDVLAAAEPDTYFWTDHHERSPLLVLVRLERIGLDELGELLRDSYDIAGNR